MNFDTLDMDVNLILDKHYTSGRQGNSVQLIGVHYNYGNLTVEGCYQVWQTRKASAHVQVESKGRSGQLVWDRDTAWALGNFPANTKSINIEHANLSDGTITEKCLDTGAHIVAAYCIKYGLGRPEWLKNVFPHKYFASTSCPGQIYGSQKQEYIERAQYWYDVMTGALKPEPEPEPEPVTPLPEVLKRFVDLDPDAWYIDPVEECVREGFMNGYDRTHFGPADSLTRGQAVCVIANFARADLSEYLEKFTDVDPSPFYYTALCWAEDQGIVSGHDGKFRPDDACSRAEFAAMLYNFKKAPDAPVLDDYEGAPEWSHAALDWAVSAKVMGNGGIRPNDPCTRAEACAMLANLG